MGQVTGRIGKTILINDSFKRQDVIYEVRFLIGHWALYCHSYCVMKNVQV